MQACACASMHTHTHTHTWTHPHAYRHREKDTHTHLCSGSSWQLDRVYQVILSQVQSPKKADKKGNLFRWKRRSEQMQSLGSAESRRSWSRVLGGQSKPWTFQTLPELPPGVLRSPAPCLDCADFQDLGGYNPLYIKLFRGRGSHSACVRPVMGRHRCSHGGCGPRALESLRRCPCSAQKPSLHTSGAKCVCANIHVLT